MIFFLRLKYQKQELESYWNRNYKDFFDSACTAKDTKVPGHARVVSICLMPLPTLSRARAVTRTRSLIRHTTSLILFALIVQCGFEQTADGKWRVIDKKVKV